MSGTSRAKLIYALITHMKHAYLQTDGTMKWPNSREGDMLRGAYAIIAGEYYAPHVQRRGRSMEHMAEAAAEAQARADAASKRTFTRSRRRK